MIDKDTIRKWWQVFVGDGGFTEVRILGKYQYSGYFKSLETLISAIEPFAEMDDEQIYFTLNEINDSCYGRQQCERIIKSPKATTTDGNKNGAQLYRQRDFTILCRYGKQTNKRRNKTTNTILI